MWVIASWLLEAILSDVLPDWIKQYITVCGLMVIEERSCHAGRRLRETRHSSNREGIFGFIDHGLFARMLRDVASWPRLL